MKFLALSIIAATMLLVFACGEEEPAPEPPPLPAPTQPPTPDVQATVAAGVEATVVAANLRATAEVEAAPTDTPVPPTRHTRAAYEHSRNRQRSTPVPPTNTPVPPTRHAGASHKHSRSPNRSRLRSLPQARRNPNPPKCPRQARPYPRRRTRRGRRLPRPQHRYPMA